MADAFVTALPSIKRFLNKFDKPFVATITPSGSVTILCTLANLIKKVD